MNGRPQAGSVTGFARSGSIPEPAAKLSIEECGWQNVAELVENLREEDRTEITRYTGTGPVSGITEAVKRSVWSLTVRLDDEILAMIGVVCSGGLLAGYGAAWCMTTELVWEHRRRFWFLSRFYLAKMRELVPNLIVDVDEDYRGAVVWLRRLGFEFTETHEVNGYRFVRGRIGQWAQQ